MRPTPRLLLGAAALALAACETPATAPAAAAPRAAVSVNDRAEIPFTALDACANDVLTGTAVQHIVMGSTTDAAGGTHTVMHVQFANIKLTGTTGASYVGNSESIQVDNVGPGATSTSDATSKLIGKGQAPNEFLRFKAHFTVNANGDLTSSVTDAVSQCR